MKNVSINIRTTEEIAAMLDEMQAATYGVQSRSNIVLTAIVAAYERFKHPMMTTTIEHAIPIDSSQIVPGAVTEAPKRPVGRPKKATRAEDQASAGRERVIALGGKIVQEGKAGRVYKFSLIEPAEKARFIRYEGYNTMPLDTFAEAVETDFFFPSKALVDEALAEGVDIVDTFGTTAPNEYQPPLPIQ